ncbi:MAG TPA: alpha/beta hydrolase [Bryobacteraceae bacterium]|nr:alpha/beta hydrolase [Bryobacteraceae bacterium]
MESTRRDVLLAGAAALAARTAAAQNPAASAVEPAWKRFFPPGFRNQRIKTSGAEINAVIGGSGPPVLLWHGAPQSLITWRLIAPDLAKDFTLVMCDLRGYGDSSKPPDGENHANYSKRAMALDGLEVMQQLGYARFPVVGHDRGGRVGRRLALDHPGAITKLAVLDIVPAHYLYSHSTWLDKGGQPHTILEFVRAYFHWFNYLRAAPGPENELKAQNDAALARATDEVQREYLRTSSTIENIHAMCEDYRASATIDLNNDEADIKAGKKIQCPLLTLWAANGAMGRLYDVLAIWKQEGVDVSGKGLPGNHSLQESAPKETLEALRSFLKS